MVMFYKTKQKKTNIVYQYQEKTIIFTLRKNAHNTQTGKNNNLSTKKKIQKTPHNTESFYRKENIKKTLPIQNNNLSTVTEIQ